jgi:hypothetical protein
MKKILIILVSLLAAIIIPLVFYNKPDNLQIIKNESYFSNFSVKGEKVYIKCEIMIKNSFLIAKTFKINAILKDDAQLGLLKSENLIGYNQDLTSNEFKIKKKSTSTFSVVFVGDFAGINKKHDRNLPEIIISPVE